METRYGYVRKQHGHLTALFQYSPGEVKPRNVYVRITGIQAGILTWTCQLHPYSITTAPNCSRGYEGKERKSSGHLKNASRYISDASLCNKTQKKKAHTVLTSLAVQVWWSKVHVFKLNTSFASPSKHRKYVVYLVLFKFSTVMRWLCRGINRNENKVSVNYTDVPILDGSNGDNIVSGCVLCKVAIQVCTNIRA
jgi:hypothetical protein